MVLLGGLRGCQKQAFAVLRARAAAEEVRGDARVPPGCLSAGLVAEDEFDVDMQDAQRLVAADVAGLSLQELVQLVPASHDRLASRLALAASAARDSRRASNIVF
jgi:hypothetical protein